MLNVRELKKRRQKANRMIARMTGVTLFCVLFLIGSVNAFELERISTIQGLLQMTIAIGVAVLAQISIKQYEQRKAFVHYRLNRIRKQKLEIK